MTSTPSTLRLSAAWAPITKRSACLWAPANARSCRLQPNRTALPPIVRTMLDAMP